MLVDNLVNFKIGETYEITNGEEIHRFGNGFTFSEEFCFCFYLQKYNKNTKKVIEIDVLGEIQHDKEPISVTNKIKVLDIHLDVEAYIESQIEENRDNDMFWILILKNGDLSDEFIERYKCMFDFEPKQNKINRSSFGVFTN